VGEPIVPDAVLSRENKKLFLFLSPRNDFWKLLSGRDLKQEEIARMIGVSASSLSSWKKTWAIGRESKSKLFQNLNDIVDKGSISIKDTQGIITNETQQRLKEMLRQFEIIYNDEEAGAYEAARVLGMRFVDCQRLIDEVVYAKAPLFPGMFYDSDSRLNSDLRGYTGVYFAWMMRGQNWLQCTLQVRSYRLEINGIRPIRCKLHIPAMGEAKEVSYWEYDGFFVGSGNRNYWTFEQRQRSHRSDYFYLITCPRYGAAPRGVTENAGLSLTMHGTYLT
jgi:hypothetical protein